MRMQLPPPIQHVEPHQMGLPVVRLYRSRNVERRLGARVQPLPDEDLGEEQMREAARPHETDSVATALEKAARGGRRYVRDRTPRDMRFFCGILGEPVPDPPPPSWIKASIS